MYKVLVALLAAPALGLPTCSQYCTSIMQVCNGTNDQFTAPGLDSATATAFCNVLCSVYPAGLDTDTSGDSLGCRAYHLAVAKNYSDVGDATNVAFHCPHAGFYGGGACGTPTDFQCDFMAANCQYQGTHAACVTNYGMYSTFVADRFNASFTRSLLKVTGATLQCRTANAFNVLQPGATPAAQALACQEAQPVSSACSLNCADFCQLEGDVCGWGTGGNNQYADLKACTDACAGWQKLAPNTTQQSTQLTSGDSADCRWYHLGVASGSDSLAATHCPHTANYPSVACTSSCDNYCATIQAACVGPNAQFADNTACLAACANYTSLPTGYARPVTAGDNLQCRSYHAFVAATNYALATAHCAHAGQVSTIGTCGAGSGGSSSSSSSSSGGSSSSSGNSASSLKVGAATAFLVLVGAVSAMFGF